MSARLLERIVRRAPLAVRLTDLATGGAVHEGVVVSARPVAAPQQGVTAGRVNPAGVTGFHRLPGLHEYEDGSTPPADWSASPVLRSPLPLVLRVEDTTGRHLTVVREVLAPRAVPLEVALPRSPSAPVPSGWLAVVATLVTTTGEPAAHAVIELTAGGSTTGGVADARGVVVVPVPRSVPPDGGGAATGPRWRLTVRVRHRRADQVAAPGARPAEPPTTTSLLGQSPALLLDGGSLVGHVERDLTPEGPLVLSSAPPPAPQILVVRPAP